MNTMAKPRKRATRPSATSRSSLYSTRRGRLYLGVAEERLCEDPIARKKGKVQLILTSPPFPLNRKKKYGNRDGLAYIEWIGSFALILREYLTRTGSIAIEIGNGWNAGQPTMSTLAMEALLAFKEQGRLHLCQEFICYNPARLPTPAQWVNVKRCRVKDAFTRVWWLSRTIKPRANNRNVLTGYSDSMKKLLEKGTYNPGKRPSHHNIGETSFLKNNNGAIPPNVLVASIDQLLPQFLNHLPALHGVLSISNTASNDDFSRYCRSNGIDIHPARMPSKLAEFFIRFLTNQEDLVMDPFAGSNTTGFVAESNKRRWLAIEQDTEYARASQWRFKRRRDV